MVVLAHDDEEVARARASGVSICLQQPLPLADIVACVGHMLKEPRGQVETATRAVGSD